MEKRHSTVLTSIQNLIAYWGGWFEKFIFSLERARTVCFEQRKTSDHFCYVESSIKQSIRVFIEISKKNSTLKHTLRVCHQNSMFNSDFSSSLRTIIVKEIVSNWNDLIEYFDQELQMKKYSHAFSHILEVWTFWYWVSISHQFVLLVDISTINRLCVTPPFSNHRSLTFVSFWESLLQC